MTISKRLFELRTERNITKKSLGKAIGVSDVAIGYWESGRSEPNASNIVALADYFDVTTDYLLGRTDIY